LLFFHFIGRRNRRVRGDFTMYWRIVGIEDCSKSFIFLEHGKYKWGERMELFRKTVSGILLFLLLVSTLTAAFNIKPVKSEWTGTVYIRADGSIDPPDAPIITYDNIVYTLIDNITSSGNCIIVERDHIVLDGAGYTVECSTRSSVIALSKRVNVTVKNFNILNGFVGIDLVRSFGCKIIRNNVTKSELGIYIGGSQYNVISENVLNGWGWGFAGIGLSYSSNNLVLRNTVIEYEWSGILLEEASDNTISENNITRIPGGTWYFGGILLGDAQNNTISDNIITDSKYGICLLAGEGDNTLDNIIEGNTINNNYWYGIYFDSWFGGSCSYNIISGNTISNHPLAGIFLTTFGGSCSYNIIKENNILNNWIGIDFWPSISSPSNNKIYHNNFLNNDYQAMGGGWNIWDDGYPSGGNYWSDYTGIDLYSGPFQNETGSDGIGDTPYFINTNNQDHYPLMHTWSPLPVHNMNTGLGYATIKEAINAPETLDRHVIFVEKGTYYENLVINKSLRLIGEDAEGTIIDGSGAGTVINITANNVIVTGFTTRNGSNSHFGISLENSNYCAIKKNIIVNNQIGIRMIYSNNNTIVGNNITNNGHGIWLFYSLNNKVFHNNFANQIDQVYSNNSVNTWDDGYPSGGNYWSDSTGIDLYSSPYQNVTGGDGIGDTPYIIDENNRDRYPLMHPWGAGIPIAGFTWTPLIPTVGEPVTFNASASMPIGGEIVNYEWNFGGGNYASGMIVTYRYSSAGTFTVTLKVSDSEGLWDIEQKRIEVKAPRVTISPLSASLIVDKSVTFTSTVSGGYPPYSYQWYLNGSLVSGATSSTWTFTPLSIGTHKVYLKVTDIYGNVAISDTATITVASQLAVSISPISASIFIGQSVTFTSNTSGGYTPYTYQWFLNGSPVSGATSDAWTFTSTTSGIYHVYLNVTDGKGNTAQSETAQITATLLGDLNGDNIVDIRDIAIVAQAFGETPEQSRWNPKADINKDGKIDIRDIAIVAKNFGKTCRL
jgi:parallel beta-helix repeat protein